MGTIPVLGFAAYSGTGKTTVLEAVVKHLKEKGLRLAVVKHDAHGLDIDRPGKDSWRFSQAGADVSIASSDALSAFMAYRKLSLEEILEQIRDVDLILVEGFKNEDIPQIGLARKATGKGFTAPPERFLAVVTDHEDMEISVPRFQFSDAEGLAEFIMENVLDFTHFNDQGRAKMGDVG